MDLLNSVLKKIFSLNPELGKGVHEARILEVWPQAMGDPIARHAKAVQIKGSTLFISVEQAVWRQELHSNKMLVLKKLNDRLLQDLGKPEGRERWIEELFFLGSGTGSGGASPASSSRSKKAYKRKSPSAGP